MNGASFESNARLISTEYDLKVSAYTVRNHILNHAIAERTKRMGLQLRELAESDEPFLTARGIHNLLMKEALLKVVTGGVSIKTMNDVFRVLEMDFAMRKTEQTAQENEQTEEGRRAMEQLGFILQAGRECVPPEYLDRAMDWAVALGMDERLR